MKAKEAKATYDRESYLFFKSQHMCKSCHKTDAFTLAGRTLCAECTEKNRAMKDRYRAEHRAELNKKNATWYATAKEEGRCVSCGRILLCTGFVTCDLCRAKRRIRDAERRRGLGIFQKGDDTFCAICARRPPMEGKRVCPSCYESNMRNLEKANAARNTRNHPWRKITHAEVMQRKGRKHERSADFLVG